MSATRGWGGGALRHIQSSVAIDPNASKSGDPLELHFAICSGIRQPFEGCVTRHRLRRCAATR